MARGNDERFNPARRVARKVSNLLKGDTYQIDFGPEFGKATVTHSDKLKYQKKSNWADTKNDENVSGMSDSTLLRHLDGKAY